MSTNFTGVTFQKQKVTPIDDALIRRRILPDGILQGCKLSYSGSTLTMSAGQLMACGRQFRHPAAQNWPIVDATTGFARLLITVDLTRTASVETFDQIVDTIEYASAEDGFPELIQEDVNCDGSKYQIVICTVSLGVGGITGIISQIGASMPPDTGLSMTLLWENASPTSAFAGQNIQLDFSQYDAAEIELYAPSAGTSHPTPYTRFFKVLKNGTCCMQMTRVGGDSGGSIPVFSFRYVSLFDDRIGFSGHDYMDGATQQQIKADNTALVPVRIYGIKGVQK